MFDFSKFLTTNQSLQSKLSFGHSHDLFCCTPFVSVVGGFGLLALLLLVLLLVRFYYKKKRQYKTYEAADAQYFDSPDYAVASGSTMQPEVQKKKEYFM